MTTAERTYRIEERLTAAGVAEPINVIVGLTKETATMVAAALQTGSAYAAGDRELMIVKELTQAEKIAAAVDAWRTTGAPLNSTAELAAALQSVLNDLATLGDQPIPATHLAVNLRVDAPAAGADEQADTVVVLGEVLRLEVDRPAGGHLTTPAGLPVRVMTTAHPATQPTAPRRPDGTTQPARKASARSNRPVSAPPAAAR